ncbi:hypothetical protein E1293_09280 [Actinomadura darangshiensis]|uniref:Uncharacterized protein n=1 Tax=Actinomadura darangshiensis TaxID=705336 RepID=A0A4R5BMY3_9ACTN|nr:hypothetical protein [Actinomadura darangshiensis]TDD86693.1 hypothetical protein E1293_09280 [Actinomadura darangshiensis]
MSADRVAALCEHLDHDPDLLEALDELPADRWDELVEAVRSGAAADVLVPLLDAVDGAAAAAGLDGLTTGTRRYEPLPGGTAGVRAVRGWRCPHPHPCGRVGSGGGDGTPGCALTSDPLAPVKVVSE